MNIFFFAPLILLFPSFLLLFDRYPVNNQSKRREAHHVLLRKNDAFLTNNLGKILGQELGPFNLTIDSLEQRALQLVKGCEQLTEEVDAKLREEFLFNHGFKVL